MTNIRLATIHDLDALVQIEEASFAPDKYHLQTRQQYRHLLTRGNCDILLALDDQTPSGMLSIFYRKGANWGRMYSIAVKPEFQKGRIGKDLYLAFEKRLHEKKLRYALLEIRADNQRHLDRYLGLGYKEVRRAADYYPNGSACIKLKKDLHGS